MTDRDSLKPDSSCRRAGEWLELGTSGLSIPAGQAGGDFFTFVPHGQSELLLAIGDVMGKGPGAAALTAVILRHFYECLEAEAKPRAVVARLNQTAGSALREARAFATFCLLAFDRRRGRVNVVNAGHHPPILVSQGELLVSRARGVALGLLEDFRGSEPEKWCLQPGDLVVAYTDGLLESASGNGERYGRERLERMIRANAGVSAPELQARIMADFNAFDRAAGRRDDVTLAIVKVEDRKGVKPCAG